MRARTLLALCVLLLWCRPASADLRVMCYGDSITAGTDAHDRARSYPGELQRLRPDLDVVNEGRGGDVSDDLARFRKALAEWPPDVVVLLLGTNDAVCNPRLAPFCASSTATPERTVANLLRMADEARGVGATVLILTPPPAVCTGSCATKHAAAFATAVRDAFTARVAEELRHTHPPAGVRVADLRGRFTDASWEALSLDGLHPSAEGDRIIAAFVAAHIPRPRAAGDTSKARAARDTSKARVAPDTSPFARHPLDGSPAD